MRSLYILFLATLFSACSSAPPVPVDHFYRLTLDTQEISSQELSEDGIYVEYFIAEGLYNERALLYTGKSGIDELQQYHYHFWITSPPRLLHDNLVRFLRETNTTSVIMTEPVLDKGIRIAGKLNAFERWNTGDQSLVNIALELKAQKIDEGGLLLLKEYQIREEVQGEGIPAVVAAFNRAVLQIYSDFLLDLQSKLR